MLAKASATIKARRASRRVCAPEKVKASLRDDFRRYVDSRMTFGSRVIRGRAALELNRD